MAGPLNEMELNQLTWMATQKWIWDSVGSVNRGTYIDPDLIVTRLKELQNPQWDVDD